MKHKTLWLVLFWLVAVLGGLAATLVGAQLPLSNLVNLAGAVSLAYVGVDKAAKIVTAAKAPAGDFGADYVPPALDKHLWVVILWLLVFGLTLVCAAFKPDVSSWPVEAALFYAGTLSAAYVGLDKGVKIAAASGVASSEAAK
jgi:hypothetical protein